MMMRTTGALVATLVLMAGCRGAGAEGPADSTGRSAPGDTAASQSEPATDGKLEIRLEIQAGTQGDDPPMRTALLHFRNRSTEPLRFYLPRPDMFRGSISTLVFWPESGAALSEPEPQPHGYVVTEEDFPLLAPGESRSFPQKFTIDPVSPGGDSERAPGFDAGSSVTVRWAYQNRIERWAGGQLTLDGPTKSLFGGERIPHIWLGKLTVSMRWQVPD